MSDFCNVVWREGMFLRPQHFQQQERSFNFQLKQSVQMQSSYYWGINSISFDQAILSNGKFALCSVKACFGDGTCITSPARDVLPPPISLDSSVRDQLIYLALPMDKVHGVNISEKGENITRYHFSDHEVVDTTVGTDSSEVLQLAKLGLELKLGSESLSGYDTIAIAKVISVSEEGEVTLDEAFIPSCLDAQQNQKIVQVVTELRGILCQRAEALAARVGSGQGSASSIADFLMLQLLNRYDAILGHIIATEGMHPEKLYKELLGFAGELATFSDKRKRAVELPKYRHDELTKVFGELSVVLNQFMSMVLEQTAVQLSINEAKYGIRIIQVPDKALLERAEFILAVNASISPDELRKHFPAQVKIGPVEHIRELVNNQLPGIPVIGLPVAPRQIPYHAGYHYFRLDKSNDYWTRLTTSGGIALHLSGHYPDLDIQMWSITQ